MTRIYKLLSAAEWAVAKAAGRFDGSDVDLADDYIHFSTAGQLEETARRHFSGRAGLVCFAVDSEGLDDLRWEPSRGGALFAHLFGSLDTSRVLDVWPIALGPDGAPIVETVFR